MWGLKPAVSREESAFQTALRADPWDDVTALVYADWLDEHRRPDQAHFLRLRAEAYGLMRGQPGPLPWPRSDAREIVRNLRTVMKASWLAAIGDKGLVGEVVVYATRCIERKVYFGAIVAEGWWKVTVAPLKKHWEGRDECGGMVMPELPDAGEFRAMVAAGKGWRCRKGEDVFICRRPYREYSFWDGASEYLGDG